MIEKHDYTECYKDIAILSADVAGIILSAVSGNIVTLIASCL